MPGFKAHSKEDATIDITVDPSFTGILRGVTDYDGECTELEGTCRLTVHRPIRIRQFRIVLEGRCKVKIKSGSTVGVPTSEGLECRTVIYRTHDFLEQDMTLDPGSFVYPFKFDLPPDLPATFHGKRGAIRYRLRSHIKQLSRVSSMFSGNDVSVKKELPIRRCLLNDLPVMGLVERVQGKDYPEKLVYHAQAPTLVYREGGLIHLDLHLQVKEPHHLVRSVTCALRERVHYRTTGQQSLTCQSASLTDESFPLGWSTFYPSKDPDYDPTQPQTYNAVFRVCPRVNSDTAYRLLRVSHHVAVNIMLEKEPHDTCMTPPPTLSRSSSSSSISSIFSLGRSSSPGPATEDIKLTTGNGGTHHVVKRDDGREVNQFLCSLELPLVVASRERCWEGDMPSPPAYKSAEEPPSYGQTLEQLPPVPFYPTS
ncbi:hypothetical protein BCR43DRAFT_509238 [Syncephalastrum racemosum]|uniref:Arrestin-like N-terminal domain-containing protein n=1 Tax=Syncephalastrum racemosum TaxID=13706 RepID=A0A1X2GZ73_SYNRA|nr:hypothetical protein BCR43DRAFT_509238 [Syncephalastrum racemosum]